MKVKFGIHTGAAATISDSIQSIQQLEKMGFDSIWLADHLVALNRNGRCFDPWSIIASLAPHTKRVIFGSMVTDPFRRHPAVFAQTVATIDWITGGRLAIGIGAGEAMNVEPFNILWNHRGRRLAEFIEILRMLWTGKTLNFDGEFFKLKEAFIQALPMKEGKIPICIAANSTFTRKVVGRLGDGWIAEMMSPETYKKDLLEVKQAADKAGRDINDIDVIYHGYCTISKNDEEAKARTFGPVRMQFTWWPKQLERYGYTISDRCDWNSLIVDEGSYEDSRKLSLEVPENVAEMVTIAGDVDECITKIENYIKAGVTHFGFSIPGDKTETLKSLEEKVIPYFREMFI